MIDLIINSLTASLVILGIHVAFDYLYSHFTGKDLGDLYDSTKNIPIIKHIIKPVILCPTCMSSFWGTIFFLLYSDLNKILFFPYCCIVVIFTNIISKKLL